MQDIVLDGFFVTYICDFMPFDGLDLGYAGTPGYSRGNVFWHARRVCRHMKE